MSHYSMSFYNTSATAAETELAAQTSLITVGNFALVVAVISFIIVIISLLLTKRSQKSGMSSDLPEDLRLIGIVLAVGAIILAVVELIRVFFLR